MPIKKTETEVVNEIPDMPKFIREWVAEAMTCRNKANNNDRVTAGMGNMRFETLWKKELLKTANLILQLYGKKIRATQIFTLENKIMKCLLHIRRNRDFYCNAERKYPQTIEVRRFPVRGDAAADIHWVMRRVDVWKGKNVTVKLEDLCNDYIYVNVNPSSEPCPIATGMFFYSDNEANGYLMMELFKFAEVLFSVEKDEEIRLEPEFDNEGNLTHFEVTKK